MHSPKQHGGRRPGAGRPSGQGPYGEATRPVRIPLSLVEDITQLLSERRSLNPSLGDRPNHGPNHGPDHAPSHGPRGPMHPAAQVRQPPLQIFRPRLSALRQALPLYRSQVAAGFPSPADDYLEDSLDLNELLISHPAATFLVRASGESMLGVGIHPGDVMVVDRSVDPSDGKIVIAVVDAELTVKRFRRQAGRVFLQAENPAFPNIDIDEAQDFRVWGVVVSVIHKL